jgi:hypothetical protein
MRCSTTGQYAHLVGIPFGGGCGTPLLTVGLLRCFFRRYCSSLKALLLITLALAPATNRCAPVLLNLIHLELLLLRSFEVHDHFPS